MVSYCQTFHKHPAMFFNYHTNSATDLSLFLHIFKDKNKMTVHVSRWLFWVWATSVRTTWWTYLWLICYRTGRASPGRAMTGWSHALNPPPFLRAFSHWCWCSACPRPRLQRWRCTPSGTWSPSGRVMDLACLTTIGEMLCWPGCYLKSEWNMTNIKLPSILYWTFECCAFPFPSFLSFCTN